MPLRNILLFTLLSLSAVLGFSQSEPENQAISRWFLEERFIIADQNEDALLSRQEMQAYSNEFVYFLSSRVYNLTDLNQDGYLSFNEMFSRRKSENLYRYNMERRQLRSIARDYPFLPQADVRYLKKQPELVSMLFGNVIWMYEHVTLAEAVFKDKGWMDRHPQVKLALHQNLRWMAANPMEARTLYRDRQITNQLPHLLSWRADHKTFLRQYPKLNRFYELDYIPANARRARN
ncbi:MAG: EF-hand domain-containing protein [Bacteroidota bacterium]